MPRRSFRPYLVYIILGLNICVYYMWGQHGAYHQEWMQDNFLVSWNALKEGRYWTLLTSVFSHNWDIHLLCNMVVLWSFGAIFEEILGRVRFLSFYLVAGIISSLCHCLVTHFLLGNSDMAALGASGALSALVWVFALLFPKERLWFFFVIPLPAIIAALIFVGLDLWGLSAQVHGGGLPIGHGAHLGGAVTGIVYYLLYLRRRVRRHGS
jgi:membrane associated rhomboid family serine protease